MRRFIFLLCFFLISSLPRLLGQELPTIQTDRPDQTECPFIVPVNHIQIETGFILEQIDEKNKSYSLPTILYRYGVNDKFEIRLITEYAKIQSDNINKSGLNPITVGFKTNLSKQKGILPETSFLGHITFPELAGADMKTTYSAPSFRFSMQHDLSKTFSLAYNLGAEWDGETPEPTFVYTITTGISITEKFGSYLEVFGFVPRNSKAYHQFDYGFNYLLKNNIMIDISSGLRLLGNSSKYYAALGFSFRL